MAAIFKGEKSAAEFDSLLARETAAYPKNSIRMLFSSNHDENAWDMPDVEKFGAEGAKLAAVLVNTFPGAPLIYNGQEVGNNVTLGLFEKFEIDWTKKNSYTPFYQKLYAIRKNNPSLAAGDYQNVKNNRADQIYTFIRTDGKNTILAAFNFSNGERTAQLELPKIFSSLKFTNAFTGKNVAYKNVEKITLPKFGYRVFIVE